MNNLSQPIVSVKWLYQNLENPNLIILDATILRVIANKAPDHKKKIYIKGARFLDIKNGFSDVNAPFPNTMLLPELFEKKAQELGINQDSIVVVYDDYGYYSCARVWWMFKTMGHRKIYVLDGGLLAWRRGEYPIMDEPISGYKTGDFKSIYLEGLICQHKKVLNSIDDKAIKIIDARSSDRYFGIREEPRVGLRSGHIPNSISLPYSDILNGDMMKPKNELEAIFHKYHNKEIIFSCGSGITACILALGAEIAGIKNKSIYDGSWTEWGSKEELPIEK